MANPKNPALTRLQTVAPGNLGLSPTSSGGTKPMPTALATPSIFSATTSSRLPAAIPSKNPLALRLYKVLGANYNDASTREALETLSSFYAPPVAGTQAPILSLNGGKQDEEEELEEDEEDGEEQAWGREFTEKARRKDKKSIDPSVAPVDGELALRARRNLRRDVEAKLTESSRKFLTAFAEVDKVRSSGQLEASVTHRFSSQKLDVLQIHVTAMQIQCDEAQQKLQATNESCKHLLDRAEGLRTQRCGMLLTSSRLKTLSEHLAARLPPRNSPSFLCFCPASLLRMRRHKHLRRETYQSANKFSTLWIGSRRYGRTAECL